MDIRPEQHSDIPAVRAVNQQAFGQPVEARIVDQLRSACPDAVSLVAVSGNQVVGHILFTPVILQSQSGTTRGMGLVPMAVLPQHQRKGIGSRLVKFGLQILSQRACPFVVVLGHPEYYPRFGFVPASRHGLRCQWENVPDEAFMVCT